MNEAGNVERREEKRTGPQQGAVPPDADERHAEADAGTRGSGPPGWHAPSSAEDGTARPEQAGLVGGPVDSLLDRLRQHVAQHELKGVTHGLLYWCIQELELLHAHAGQLKCEGCGLLYRDFPCDCTVTDEVWKQIMGRDGGVLCPNCIARRIVKEMRVSYVVMMPGDWKRLDVFVRGDVAYVVPKGSEPQSTGGTPR